MTAILIWLCYLAFPVLAILAAARDLTHFTLPNWISGALALAFAAFALITGLPGLGVLQHIGVAALVLAAGFGLFLPGWIGGGDAKFAAAAALWMGPGGTVPFLAIAAILGGFLTIAVLLFRRQALPLALARIDWIDRLHDTREGVPYGVALALGALLIFPYTDTFAFMVRQLDMATSSLTLF